MPPLQEEMNRQEKPSSVLSFWRAQQEVIRVVGGRESARR